VSLSEELSEEALLPLQREREREKLREREIKKEKQMCEQDVKLTIEKANKRKDIAKQCKEIHFICYAILMMMNRFSKNETSSESECVTKSFVVISH
jgi:hypothetical protein